MRKNLAGVSGPVRPFDRPAINLAAMTNAIDAHPAKAVPSGFILR